MQQGDARQPRWASKLPERGVVGTYQRGSWTFERHADGTVTIRTTMALPGQQGTATVSQVLQPREWEELSDALGCFPPKHP